MTHPNTTITTDHWFFFFSSFKSSKFYRLVNPKVVQACTVVLSDWERLPARIIKSAVTLLHRIAFGCKVPIMLFQVSIKKKPILNQLIWMKKYVLFLYLIHFDRLKFMITSHDSEEIIFLFFCLFYDDRYHYFEYFNKYLRRREMFVTMKFVVWVCM